VQLTGILGCTHAYTQDFNVRAAFKEDESLHLFLIRAETNYAKIVTSQLDFTT